jgi:hypothetical protein
MRAHALLPIALMLGALPAQESGAVHWSDRPVVRGSSDIDDLVQARLAAEGLRPSPEADASTLVRRLHLTLHGLPPTKAELDRGIATIASGPRGFGELVDDLCRRTADRLERDRLVEWSELAGTRVEFEELD